MTLEEEIISKDEQAKELAKRLEPYLNTQEAKRTFEYYGQVVRERAEAVMILRILHQNGY